MHLNFISSSIREFKEKKTVLYSIFYSLFISLSGCTNNVILKMPALTKEKSKQLTIQRQQYLTKNTQFNQSPLPTSWWTLFQDPILDQLQQIMLKNNLDYQNALLRIDESQSALGQVAALLKPQVNFNADYSRQAISQFSPVAQLGASTNGFNLWTMGLQSSWELDLWGYLRHQKNAAQTRVEAQFYQAEQVRVSLSAELTRQYILLRNTQEQRQVMQHIFQLQQNMVRVYENKQNNGIATNVDIATQKSKLFEIQEQLNTLTQQSDILINTITLLLALAPHDLDTLLNTKTSLQTPQHLPIGMVSDFVKNRPDILVAEAELRTAINTVYAAKADFYPRIGISTQIGKQAFSLTNYGNWNSRIYGIGPTLHLPIFTGGQLKKTLILTEIQQQQAALHYQKTVLNAWHEIDHAFIDYQHSQQNIFLLEQQFFEKQKIVKTMNRQLEQGVDDQTHTLQAEIEMAQIQLNQLNHQTATQLSIVSLYRALGEEGSQYYSANLKQVKS